MNTRRKLTAIGLVIVLIHLYVADLAIARSAKSSVDPAAIKQRVELLGVGTKLEVNLKGEERLVGTIQSIADDNFAVTRGDSEAARHIAYDQVQGLTPAKLSYKASGHPNASEARRVVAGWGVGKAIRVTLADGRKLKGKIQSMDKDHFTLLSNSHAEPSQIAYTDVQQVGTGGMTTGTSWAIGGGVLAGVAVVLVVLATQIGG